MSPGERDQGGHPAPRWKPRKPRRLSNAEALVRKVVRDKQLHAFESLLIKGLRQPSCSDLSNA